jgi:HEAT repeat protein
MRKTPAPLACSLALAAALAASSPAADPAAPPRPEPPAPRDVRTMTARELLAEFHGAVERVRPASQWRVDLVNALRRLGPALTDTLRPDLVDPDPAVRTRALWALAAVGNKARPLVTEVMAAAASDNPSVRAAALPVLCHLRDPRAFGLLVRASRDPDPAVRSSLLRNGHDALADAPFALAVGALDDADINVRMAAVGDLGLRKDKRAVAHLLPHLDDETVLHHDVRGGVRTTRRVSDEVVHSLELLVNGTYLLPGEKTQADYDALVQRWKAWRKADGPAFDEALYEEPEVKRANR